MHATSNIVKYVDAQQAKIVNLYRNTKYKSYSGPLPPFVLYVHSFG